MVVGREKDQDVSKTSLLQPQNISHPPAALTATCVGLPHATGDTSSAVPTHPETHNKSEQGNIYTPLDLSPENGVSTRLLRIDPELSAEGITQCQLRPVYLDITPRLALDKKSVDSEAPSSLGHHSREALPVVKTTKSDKQPRIRYNTLSYLWGTQKDLQTILVNGQQHQVGQNLKGFLDYIRGQPWLVTGQWWIDALCIDQANDAEKSYQVRSMGLIYCNAALSICWLGYGLEVYDIMFDVVHTFAHKVMNNPRRWQVYDGSLDSSPQQLDKEGFEEACQEHSHSVEEWRESFVRLLTLPYWRRAWVNQEVYLPSNVYIVTSSRSIPIHSLALADSESISIMLDNDSDALMVAAKHSLLISSKVAHYMFLDQNPRRTRKSSMYLKDPFTRFRYLSDFQCSDPRDIIYSQLAMVRNGFQFHIDYAEDRWCLFLRVALFCCDKVLDEKDSGIMIDINDIADRLSVKEHLFATFACPNTEENEQYDRLIR